MKSDALFCLSCPNPALLAIRSAISILTTLDKETRTQNTTISQSRENGCLFDAKFREKLLVQAYNNEAIILISQSNYDEAQKVFVNALSIFFLGKTREDDWLSENFLELIYNYVVLLINTGCKKEGCIVWMDYRHISLHGSPDYYQQMIDQFTSKFLSEQKGNDKTIQLVRHGKVGNVQRSFLDILVLKHWVRSINNNAYLKQQLHSAERFLQSFH